MIVAANADGTYRVKYILRNAQEDGVGASHIALQYDKVANRRNKRSRTDVARSTYGPSAKSTKSQLYKQEAGSLRCVQQEGASALQPKAVPAALSLTLIKTKVITRAYAQDGTCTGDVTGLVSRKLFPDWKMYRHDIHLMCQPVLNRETPSAAHGCFYRETQRLLEFAQSAIDVVSVRQSNERTLLGKQARYSRRMKRNQLAAMQGTWRQTPFSLRKYIPLTR